jgi:hypothetical protein
VHGICIVVVKMDFGKLIGATVLPVVGIVVINLGLSLLGQIPLLNVISCILTPLNVLITLCLLAFAGRGYAKSANSGAMGGAAAGALAGLVSGIINAIVNLVLSMLGLGVVAALGGDPTANALGAVGSAIMLLVLPAGGLFIGAIMGAIGGLIK